MSPARIPMDQRPSGEDLRRLYVDEGMTLQQVAGQVGFSTATIRNWLLEAGVEMRSSAIKKKAPLEKRCPIPLDELQRLYVDEELSLAEIGDRIGYHAASVGLWLDELGVTKRGTAPEFLYEDGWREVISRDQVPFDTSWDGKVLKVSVDTLECGHKMREGVNNKGAKAEWVPKRKYRRCPRCIRSQEQQT